MKKSTATALKLILAAYWSCFLIRSDSYYMPYLAVCMGGCACIFYNYSKAPQCTPKWQRYSVYILSFVLAFCVAAANYALFENVGIVYSYTLSKLNIVFRAVAMLLVLAGGMVLFGEILTTVCLLPLCNPQPEKTAGRVPIKASAVFFISWFLIAALDLGLLFLVEYPGILTNDSTNQMHQLLHITEYSNHHPFYHTQIIRLMVSIGLALFGEINAAVAVYSVFQILVLSACFAYTVYTVYQLKYSWKAAVCTLAIYLLLPYHIKFSYTMWKDVLFGAAVLLLVVGVLRVVENVGSHKRLDCALMLLGALGMTLLRSNGLAAFAASALVFALLFMKRHKKTVFAFAGVIALAIVLKYPVLSAMDIQQPDTIESLSIPLQQIARVIVDGEALTPEQEELLENVVDLEGVPENYLTYISDTMKNYVRESGNQKYISEHKSEFVKLYLQLAVEHPQEFIRAWIDQTRGYWNGGYPYWVWDEGVKANQAGIEPMVFSHGLKNVWSDYLRCFTLESSNLPLLLFVSVGFNTWVVLISAFSALVRKNYAAFFASVPTVMIIGTLLVATPVYAEFRYAYAMFCCLPFIVYTSFTTAENLDAEGANTL